MDRDLNSRQPYYTLIAEELMREIRNGRFPQGTLIPTEPELCRRFAVSRVTIRGALRELELLGMISRRRGVGTRVEAIETKTRFIHDTNSIEDILSFPVELEFHLLDRREVQVDEMLSHHLAARQGERFVRIDGLRSPVGSELPVCLSAHFVPASSADALERMDGLKGSIAAAVALSAKKEIDEIEQSIDAINLEKREAALLHAKTRDAALLTWRQYKDAAGVLLMASRSIYPKERSSYMIRRVRETSCATMEEGNRLRAC
jgi:GntR family transcriptional regulator